MQRLLALAVLIAVAALASCGTGNDLMQRADKFAGSALSGFGGTDGLDATAQALAKEIIEQLEYDFTPSGFVIQNSQASAGGDAAGDYPSATGTVTVSQGQATVVLDVTSTNPDVTDVQLTGTFSVADAQQALDTPGLSFDVAWTLEWTSGGEQHSLTATQTLTGTGWVAA